jgi:hypothetical protein
MKIRDEGRPIAGKPVKLFAADSQALAWLQEKTGPQPLPRATEAGQWALFRGDESRNAERRPSSPTRPCLGGSVRGVASPNVESPSRLPRCQGGEASKQSKWQR